MSGVPIGASAVGDLTTIPLRGHLLHVWRQPGPAKHAFAWRVVRDDLASIGEGEADTAAEAWDAALALVPEKDGRAQQMVAMHELTAEDVDQLQEAYWHAAHLARVASAFAQTAIMEWPTTGVERDTARLAVKDTLDTLARDAEAAAKRLEEWREEG